MFYEKNPFGEMRYEARNALLCSVLVALHSKQKPKYSDYLLFNDNEKKPVHNWRVAKAQFAAYVKMQEQKEKQHHGRSEKHSDRT